MEFIIYGKKDLPVLMFLHGSCTTAETCYQRIAERMKKDYCCVLCRLDGHYDGAKDFSSLDDEALQIEKYIRDHFGGKIYALTGLSLGATIAVRLLERNHSAFERVILDGVYVQNKGLLYASLCAWMGNVGIAYIKKGRKIPDGLVERVFGKGNKSVIEMMYGGVSKASVKNVCHQVYRYQISDSLKAHGSMVVCVRGEFEPIPEKSMELLKTYLQDIREIVIPGCGHAQFLHEKPEEYAELLYQLLQNSFDACCNRMKSQCS